MWALGTIDSPASQRNSASQRNWQVPRLGMGLPVGHPVRKLTWGGKPAWQDDDRGHSVSSARACGVNWTVDAMGLPLSCNEVAARYRSALCSRPLSRSGCDGIAATRLVAEDFRKHGFGNGQGNTGKLDCIGRKRKPCLLTIVPDICSFARSPLTHSRRLLYRSGNQYRLVGTVACLGCAP